MAGDFGRRGRRFRQALSLSKVNAFVNELATVHGFGVEPIMSSAEHAELLWFSGTAECARVDVIDFEERALIAATAGLEVDVRAPQPVAPEYLTPSGPRHDAALDGAGSGWTFGPAKLALLQLRDE
jgi:hypothetical protein